MKYEYEEKNKKLKINLDGDIDMNSCRTLRTIVDGYIMRYSPTICEIDMSCVKFMDSSGLGFIMGRYNLAKMLGCNLIITNPDNSIKKLLSMYKIENGIKVMQNVK
mgnify:CR=1 FL=1